jgi:dienelactone hydrolase
MLRKALVHVFGTLSLACMAAAPVQVTFPSRDGVTCTADLYLAKKDASTPFIVLFHQAGYSRGEYREIAPRLNALGFNCLALDARSGGEAMGVKNATAEAAEAAGKPIYRYLDALPDLSAALQFARETCAKGKLIAWGSSYSASLAIHLAAAQPSPLDGVLAFSPGEYFPGVRPDSWITGEAAKITAIPVFITSGPQEGYSWKRMYEAIPSPQKASFLPEANASLHGSSVLWHNLGSEANPVPNPLAERYWTATEAFLRKYLLP